MTQAGHEHCNHPVDMTPQAVAAAVELLLLSRIHPDREPARAGHEALRASYTDPYDMLLLYLTTSAAAFSVLRHEDREPLTFLRRFADGTPLPDVPQRALLTILSIGLAADTGLDPGIEDLLDDPESLRATPDVTLAFAAEVVSTSADTDGSLGRLREALITALSYACPGGPLGPGRAG